MSAVVVTPLTKNILNNLPQDITLLDCSNLRLKKLPKLSHLTNLRILYCYDNNLTEIPLLPPSVVAIYCHNNRITNLNCLLLSTHINTIVCHNNRIKDLPDFRRLPNLSVFSGAINKFDHRIVSIMTRPITFEQKIQYLELNNLFDKPLPPSKYGLIYKACRWLRL
jgi:Leucine-rich repeat (LRR) protein